MWGKSFDAASRLHDRLRSHMAARFYLDHNATTPVHPDASRAMTPFLAEQFGNPSSIHARGRAARAAMDAARDGMASLLGAKSKEIVFTSGGTESNNLALFGAAHAHQSRGRHVVTCATEHHAVLHPCERLRDEGWEVTVLPVDAMGRLDVGALADAIRPETLLVSIMSANNETGTRQPVREIGVLCRGRGVLFHCDATQSFGKERVHVGEWNADLLSITAHKFYGPKGAALLYARSGVQLQPQLLGGAHEHERRAGTENVAAIAGMAAAAGIASQQAEAENKRLFTLTENLWAELSRSIMEIRRNGHATERLGNTLNVSFSDCDGEALLMGLDLEGVEVSSGSACMVGSVQPSHVLKAMGVDAKLATARFSLGSSSKEEHIPKIVSRVKLVVGRVRQSRS